MQSGIALKAIIPHLRVQAERLNQELVALEKIDADIENNLQILQQTSVRLQTERRRIRRLINHKKLLQKSLQMQAETEQQAITTLIARAASLQDFLKALMTNAQQRTAKPTSVPLRPASPQKSTPLGKPQNGRYGICR